MRTCVKLLGGIWTNDQKCLSNEKDCGRHPAVRLRERAVALLAERVSVKLRFWCLIVRNMKENPIVAE
jgi:hypothetical protein